MQRMAIDLAFVFSLLFFFTYFLSSTYAGSLSPHSDKKIAKAGRPLCHVSDLPGQLQPHSIELP